MNITVDKNIDKAIKIVFISDLHIGYGIGRKEVEQWVELINCEKADLVLIAGDVIDNYIEPLDEENIHLALREIKAKHGVFMALGNHEYFGNIENRIEFFNRSNINVLRDSSVLINNQLYVVGREEFSRIYRRPLSSVISDTDHSKPIIVIDHQPVSFQEAKDCNVDLLLSGHTHNGQFFPFNIVVKMLFNKSYGFYSEDKTNFYVTSGIGLWGGKFRIATRSEYVVINLS